MEPEDVVEPLLDVPVLLDEEDESDEDEVEPLDEDVSELLFVVFDEELGELLEDALRLSVR